jgi:hypothetical protein
MTKTARFAVGDIIVWGPPYGDGTVRRQITEVRQTGYEWRYPDQGEVCASGHTNSFMSENSNDPFLQAGWVKVA